MENFLYAIKNAKRMKFVDIDFDLFRYAMEASEGDLLITHDDLLGIVYYYLFSDLSKEISWKSVKDKITKEKFDELVSKYGI